MNLPDDPQALFRLVDKHAKSGDAAALSLLSSELERLAGKSGQFAYLASLVHELFDSSARQSFLIQSAELGFPAAQLDAAANFALGLNGFPRDASQSEKWLGAAEKTLPAEAAALRSRMAHKI